MRLGLGLASEAPVSRPTPPSHAGRTDGRPPAGNTFERPQPGRPRPNATPHPSHLEGAPRSLGAVTRRWFGGSGWPYRPDGERQGGRGLQPNGWAASFSCTGSGGYALVSLCPLRTRTACGQSAAPRSLIDQGGRLMVRVALAIRACLSPLSVRETPINPGIARSLQRRHLRARILGETPVLSPPWSSVMCWGRSTETFAGPSISVAVAPIQRYTLWA